MINYFSPQEEIRRKITGIIVDFGTRVMTRESIDQEVRDGNRRIK